MLAVRSLAAMSRFCSASAIAGASFSAVARGPPLSGAIATRGGVAQGQHRRARLWHVVGEGMRQRLAGRQQQQPPRARLPARRRGHSLHQQNAGGERAEEAERQKQDQIGHRGSDIIAIAPPASAVEHDRREAAAEDRLAAQAGATIAEETLLLGDGVAMRRIRPLPRREPGEAALDIARKVEHEMAGARAPA